MRLVLKRSFNHRCNKLILEDEDFDFPKDKPEDHQDCNILYPTSFDQLPKSRRISATGVKENSTQV